jgi:protein FAM32A
MKNNQTNSSNLMKMNFVGGKLNLKNQKKDKSLNIMKKVITKDIKSRQIEKKHSEEITNEEIVGFMNQEEANYIKSLEQEIQDLEKMKKAPDYKDTRTPAEKLFDERKMNRLPEKIKKGLIISYKEKYENFNKALSKLPEHYDIPKVGPG